MLVLSRRVGEACVIGENISVTVLRVNGNQVRLGIAAPAEIPVHRQEMHDRMRVERRKVEQHFLASNATHKSS